MAANCSKMYGGLTVCRRQRLCQEM